MLCSLVFDECIAFFFFNDTATTEIYTLSLHDALPISCIRVLANSLSQSRRRTRRPTWVRWSAANAKLRNASRSERSCAATSGFCTFTATWRPSCSRSEEHTSELQSQSNLVCRLLLEKKKKPKE